MGPLMNPLRHPIGEAQVALLALDAAVLSVEGKVFLIDSISARLPDIAVQCKGNGSASRAEPGLIVQVTILLSREDSLTVGTFVISLGVASITGLRDLECREPCHHIFQCLDDR